jgi:hypothetical protein
MSRAPGGHRAARIRPVRSRHDPTDERGETFRLTIFSDRPLELPGYPVRRDAGGGYVYECGRVGYTAFDSNTIADRLDRYAFRILDRLERSGISSDALAAPGVEVRAYLGIEGYAHTVGARLVQRLSRVHASLWIEATP